MSGFKNFGVAGAGNIGKGIVKALLHLKKDGAVTSVKVLTRSGGKKFSELADLGATFVEVNYDDPTSLKEALAGTEVVISTVGALALGAQTQLADASKAAGVQLFVPSEFGGPTEGGVDNALFEAKFSLQKHLKEQNLPFALFFTGLFSDFIFKPIFGFDFKNGKVTIGGSGNEPISFTSIPDIGRFVAHVLTTLPRKDLEWHTFRIEGDRLSFNNLISLYEQRSGSNIQLTKRSRAELQAAVKENSADFVSFLFLHWDLGGGVIGRPEEISNRIWPEWKPKSVIDILVEENA
ncbi:NAD-P-binding protein [Schizopora paradoxa]|uniref:NAD-P-binding protein n=1 Tax=Schizopora paradoxa TaxID=27342 RepID=A0A0H2S553_9AGAM|nr:NAD-P-binding protein [Schizopora paradoxa]